MRKIAVLDQHTIDKIAAGEVVERPSSVVKELVENAIDAGATAITVEITDGGKKLIRITDNGGGMEAEQVPLAFLRHATSKIEKIEDLEHIASLGFRGEALSSIAAVSQVELITKTPSSISGVRYIIEGGQEHSLEELGAPEGTTFLVRNLFYNTPARSKFLKSDTTEGNYISTLMEQLALSHPEISFKYIQNKQVKLHTSGNYSVKDVIYNVYGRDIARSLLEISYENDFMKITGFAGKPEISRGNRTFENYYINGRYVKNNIITKAIEDAYKGFLMQHKFPFVSLHMEMDGNDLDVNVHPAKREVRFARGPEVYDGVYDTIRRALTRREMIPEVTFGRDERVSRTKEPIKRADVPEPFEAQRRAQTYQNTASSADIRRPGTDKPEINQTGTGSSISHQTEPGNSKSYQTEAGNSKSYQSEAGNSKSYQSEAGKMAPEQLKSAKAESYRSESRKPDKLREEDDYGISAIGPAFTRAEESLFSGTLRHSEQSEQKEPNSEDTSSWKPNKNTSDKDNASLLGNPAAEPSSQNSVTGEQLEMFEEKLLSPESRKHHQLIGQLFDTYWLVQFGDEFYIIDQHAAHEKVFYERLVRQFQEQTIESQYVSPPMIVTLNLQEESLLKANEQYFRDFGFEIEPFGGKEYCISAVPSNLYGFTEEGLFLDMLDHLAAEGQKDALKLFTSRLATMACKAAVKGNHRMSPQEADSLIDELLTLENPYHCPHGRPTIISMTRAELEKKFKRIV